MNMTNDKSNLNACWNGMAYEELFVTESLDAIFTKEKIKLDIVLIMVCRCGRMEIEVNDARLTFTAGDLLIGTPGMLVGKYLHSHDFEHVAVGLPCKTVNSLQRQFFNAEPKWWDKLDYISNNSIIHLTHDQHHTLAMLYDTFKCISNETDNRYSQRIAHNLLQIMIYEFLAWLDHASHVEEVTVKTRISRSDAIFRNFISLLNANPQKSKNLSWYAEQLYISTKHLSTVCRKVSGRTCKTLIDEALKSDILDMLLHTDLAVKEVSARLGFANPSFFGKYVKEHFGCTPGQIRANEAAGSVSKVGV